MTFDPNSGAPADSTDRPEPPAYPPAVDSGLPCPQRRAVLRGGFAIGALGLTGGLAACGQDLGTPNDQVAAPPPAEGGTGGAGGTGQGGAGGGAPLGPVSEVPVGGGKVYSEQQVIVTQPTAGQFKGFSAICTHEQCTVAGVEEDVILCRCHLSKFSPKDGSVVGGPAPAPLPPKNVTVSGDQITLA